MSVHRHQGGWVIAVTFAVAIMLALAPMPDWADRLRPQWVAMVLVYWAMALPERVGVGIGWSVGILLDVARGTLLGQHALALTVLAFVTHKSHMRLRVLPLWQQAGTILLFLLVYQLIVQWINGISGYPPRDLWYLLPPLISTLLWPWVFVVLRDLRRRLIVV